MGDTTSPATETEGKVLKDLKPAKRLRNEYEDEYSREGKVLKDLKPAKRLRSEYEDEYSRDRSLSDVYLHRREDRSLADSGGDREGVVYLHRREDRSLADSGGDREGVVYLHPKEDRSLADREGVVYLHRREDRSLADRDSDREGVGLLKDHVRAPAAPFLDDHRSVQHNGPLPSSSSGLTVGEGLNLRSDSHRLDPISASTGPVPQQYRLPADASDTLFVEGVPINCSSREVAHIFRPFRGFKEVRLVKRYKVESKRSRGAGAEARVVAVLCFVEFDNPKCATTALECVQGYIFDEYDRDSPSLSLEFARSLNEMNVDRNQSSFVRYQDRGRDKYRRRR